MLNKDPNGKTVRERRGSSILPHWVYHFENSDYRSPDWDETTYQSILKTQESTPVVVGKKDRRVWWLFRRNFYSEEEGHSADQVKALVTGNAQGIPKPAAPSVAPEVKKSETPLEQSLVSSTTSGRTKLLKLTCPSCGGSLELPDNLTVAHCIYCGNKILLDQDGVSRERRDLQRYVELCKVAVEAKNYNETIEYCNRILELDPNNIEAWMNKAVSTFFLSTTALYRYDEAMEYLNKALQIAPTDARIANTRNELTRQQAWWLNSLGEQAWAASGRLWKSIADSGSGLYALKVADENSRPHYVRAMEYFLGASSYSPENIRILENIAGLVKDANWIQWSERVHAKTRTLELVRAKTNALGQLPKLKEELQKEQSDLATFQTQGGFLTGFKINSAQSRITRLQADIENLEKDAAYDPLSASK